MIKDQQIYGKMPLILKIISDSEILYLTSKRKLTEYAVDSVFNSSEKWLSWAERRSC